MNKVINNLLVGSKIITKIMNKSLSTSNSLVDLAVNDKTGLAIVTMNNPPVNAMTMEFMKKFCSILDELERNKTRGMILTSALANVFCAGLNINEFYKPDKSRLSDYYSTFQDTRIKLFSSPFTTLAAINGHAPAGGCMLTLTTEYRIMKEKYTIGLNEAMVGIVAPAWLMEDMATTITTRNAEMALTLGKMFSTEEALEINLIDEMVSSNDELMARAEYIINEFNKIDPEVRCHNKNVFRQKRIKEFEKNRIYDRDTFVHNVLHPDAQATIETYLKSLKSKKSKKINT